MVSSPKANFSITLIGNEINNFVFKNPGVYQIQFIDTTLKHSESCNHSSIKANMKVFVSPIKIEYDFKNIQFSRNISVGTACDDILVTVPAKIMAKEIDIKNLKIKVPDLTIAGVGCEIKAEPIILEMQLRKGVCFFEYRLSGQLKNSAYLMFDFTDSNNQVQSYNPTKIID